MNRERILQGVLGDGLRLDEPMSRHTTLKVGGPARWFWPATDTWNASCRALSGLLRPNTTFPIYLIVGHGSNLLMSDHGYDGLVIQEPLQANRKSILRG